MISKWFKSTSIQTQRQQNSIKLFLYNEAYLTIQQYSAGGEWGANHSHSCAHFHRVVHSDLQLAGTTAPQEGKAHIQFLPLPENIVKRWFLLSFRNLVFATICEQFRSYQVTFAIKITYVSSVHLMVCNTMKSVKISCRI